MANYSISGLCISSEIDLPEATFAAKVACRSWQYGPVAIVRGRPQGSRNSPQLPTSPPVMEWSLPDGSPWLHCYKGAQGYLLRFQDLSDFLVSGDGREICVAVGRATEETVRHLILDQVIPLVVNLQGGQALHASSILCSCGVYAFAARAGSGKSSLAAAFMKAGYPVLSDDCLRLEFGEDCEIYGLPSYGGLRLWKKTLAWFGGDAEELRRVAEYTSKRRLMPKSPVPVGPERVAGIFLLSRGAGSAVARVRRLPQSEALRSLLPFLFRIDPTDRGILRRELRFMSRLVSAVPIFHLSVPDDLSSLPQVRDLLLGISQQVGD